MVVWNKRNELIANLVYRFVFPLFFMVVVLMAAFLVNSPIKFTLTMLVLWLAGFLLFFKAKLSVIKSGKLISFGASDMSQENRVCYILGYVLMGIGFFFSLCLIAFYR